MTFIIQSIYKFCSWKAMDLSFQRQKTEHFYLFRVKFYCQGNMKKLSKIEKGLCTLRRTVKNLQVFANISGTGCDILKKGTKRYMQFQRHTFKK
jgi:hypothetical protein